MSYDLPVSVDSFWRTFACPDAQIPTGAVATQGALLLQFNSHRCALVMRNRGAGSVLFYSDNQNGFANAFTLEPGDLFVTPEFPPRNPIYFWKSGTTDFRYLEMVYQPFRQSGVEGQIRSNPQ